MKFDLKPKLTVVKVRTQKVCIVIRVTRPNLDTVSEPPNPWISVSEQYKKCNFQVLDLRTVQSGTLTQVLYVFSMLSFSPAKYSFAKFVY